MTAPDQTTKALHMLLKRLSDEFGAVVAAKVGVGERGDSAAAGTPGEGAAAAVDKAGGSPAAPGDAPDALPANAPPTLVIDPAEPILAELVWSLLLWDAGTAKALAASKRLAAAVVDFNELRVCLPDELVGVLGERYPKAAERAQRIRAALNDLFEREHAVTLQHLAAMGKREAKAYLDALDGVPPFVAARVLVLALGGHAAPVDERLLHHLVEAGVVPAGTDAEAAAAALTHRIRAGELAEACVLLQAWADQEGGSGCGTAAGAGKRPARTTAAQGKVGKAGSRE